MTSRLAISNLVRTPALLLVLAYSLPAQLITAHLSSKTNHAFDEYVKSEEAAMDWIGHSPARPGKMLIDASRGASPIQVEEGMIHDWTASTILPGATVEKALATFQDYANYKNLFAPEVIDSRLVDHDGSRWHAWLRLQRKKVLTVVLDAEVEVEYRSLGNGRWAVLSRSRKISEVDGGKNLPPDAGHGFLWRLNAYWLLEPRPEGLYMECRSISLSRDIPAGLGWVIRPMLSSVPRESLQGTMDAMRKALR